MAAEVAGFVGPCRCIGDARRTFALRYEFPSMGADRRVVRQPVQRRWWPGRRRPGSRPIHQGRCCPSCLGRNARSRRAEEVEAPIDAARANRQAADLAYDRRSSRTGAVRRTRVGQPPALGGGSSFARRWSRGSRGSWRWWAGLAPVAATMS